MDSSNRLPHYSFQAYQMSQSCLFEKVQAEPEYHLFSTSSEQAAYKSCFI